MKGVSIAVALTALVVAYIARVQGLLTDAFALESLVVSSYMTLCWAFGIGATEVYKRKRIPRPWDTPEAKDSIWIAATCFGGGPYAALLLARYWPPTAEGALLILLAGLGLGGGILPFVYRFLAGTLWPALRRMLVRVKLVRTADGSVVERPVDQPSAEDEKTLFVGAPTEPPDKP